MERTFCRICEAVCGLTAERGPGGTVTLAPDREHPVSRGYSCAKGLAFAEHSKTGTPNVVTLRAQRRPRGAQRYRERACALMNDRHLRSLHGRYIMIVLASFQKNTLQESAP